MDKPELITSPDLAELIQECQDYIDAIAEGLAGDNHEKYEIAIAEAAVKALFGRDVYDWINEHIE